MHCGILINMPYSFDNRKLPYLDRTASGVTLRDSVSITVLSPGASFSITALVAYKYHIKSHLSFITGTI